MVRWDIEGYIGIQLNFRKNDRGVFSDFSLFHYSSLGPSTLFSLGQFYFSIKILCKSTEDIYRGPASY